MKSGWNGDSRKCMQDFSVSAVLACNAASQAAIASYLGGTQLFGSHLSKCWKGRIAHCQGQPRAALQEEDSVLPDCSRTSLGRGLHPTAWDRGTHRPLGTTSLHHGLSAWLEHLSGTKWDLWNDFQTASIRQRRTRNSKRQFLSSWHGRLKQRIQNSSWWGEGAIK